jgi:methyl-accepting chemotaxis protein
MEELTTTVQQNNDNAREASKLAETASERGGARAATRSRRVVHTMGAINAARARSSTSSA